MTTPFHYPPELLLLLTDTIPLLCRSYEDTLLFFKGAGVNDGISRDLRQMLLTDRGSLNKFKIARTILTRLNEQGDVTLRERREVLKRVTEFEDFSICWPDDQLKARGLVAEIRRVINVKDAFTRINDEREREHQQHAAKRDVEIEATQRRQNVIERLKRDLFALFGETDANKRGKSLEIVLNNLFDAFGILVRQAFTLTGDSGEGIVEQVDGVIELENHLYFVEMKWWKQPIGRPRPEVSEHLVRIYHRAESRALIISASGFSEPAITTCKESLTLGKFVTLCTLEEIVMLLERQIDLKQFLKSKVQATILEKNPFPKVLV
jgi:restriction system protein